MLLDSKYFSKNWCSEISGWRESKSFPIVYPYLFYLKNDTYYMLAPTGFKSQLQLYRINGHDIYKWVFLGDVYVSELKARDFVKYSILNYNDHQDIPEDVLDGMYTIYDNILSGAFWSFDKHSKRITACRNFEYSIDKHLILPGDYELRELQDYFTLANNFGGDLKQMNTDGRKVCAKCSGPIKMLLGFDRNYNHCPICEP